MTGVVPLRPYSQNDLPASESNWNREAGADASAQFWEMLSVVLARKWMIVAIMLMGVAAAYAFTISQTPMFKATATVEIEPEEVEVIEGSDVGPSAFSDAQAIQTQLTLLQSRSLTERVAEELNLASDERYANQALPRPQRVRQAAGAIRRGLTITPQGRTRIVGVTYVSPYSAETARIANAVVQIFIQSNLERKYNTTAFAREFLEERLATAKAALEEKEREVAAYAERVGILDIAGTEGASLEATSIMSLNSSLAEAESARIEAEMILQEARENSLVRQMLEDEAIRELRRQREELKTEYEEKLDVFKPEYPDMQRLQLRIDRLDAEIEAERSAILSALEGDYEAALARERSLRARVDELADNIRSERNTRIEYTILQREVDTNRAQYQALLERQKQLAIASGIGTSQVSIVDQALAPSTPFSPNLRRTLLFAIAGSLVLGVGLAFALNYIDDTIKTPEDLRNKLGVPVIGVIPKLAKRSQAIVDALEDPKSGITEAYYSARTALDFSTSHGTPKSLLLTSTRPSEGKTSSSIALAKAYAKNGKNVLIIDADMRKPSFVVEKGQSVGLSGLLTQESRLIDEVVRSSTPGLSILPSGVVPPNPAELLSGPRLKSLIAEAEAHFDIVVVDSPPVLSFADGPLLGAVCEGALIVIESGSIRRPTVERTINRLLESRTNLLGAVLMKFDAKKAGYEYGYYYQYGGYSYGGGASAYVEDKSSKASARRKVHIASAEDVDVEY